MTLTVKLPSAGTPCSDSFHASSDSSALRAAAEVGAAVNDPRTATPVEARLRLVSSSSKTWSGRPKILPRLAILAQRYASILAL